MALRVWLPLNGNLENKGLSSLTFKMQGTLNTTAGKIGQTTYLIDDNTQYNWVVSNEKINLGINITMCAWVKASTFSISDSSGLRGIFGQHRYNTKSGMGLNFVKSTDTTGYISVNTGTGSSRTYNTYKNTTLLQSNTWYHLGFTYDGSKIRFYVNGVLDGEHSYTGQNNIEDYIELYGWSLTGDENTVYGNYKLQGAINDVRIYDECLSQKQIKEISKGLVCHYKFDDRYATNNLIINGFGELGGNIGWNKATVSTTEIPPGVSNIKASFYNGNATKNEDGYRVTVVPDHKYTLSVYIKSSGATTGKTYPSIWPYDIDKKFMDFHKTQEGFWTISTTTLTQDLNPGDTVIHAADLSKWDTGTNYGYHVAIFGYTDSTGYTYPDLKYTQDTPVFGTRTDKSNIDKTNNTITLNSAFTGEKRLAGTKICQSTEGSTYFYPFGGIDLSSLTDWVYKTATIDPNNGRLKYSKYWVYSTYNNSYHAGIQLIDNVWMQNNNIVTDCSGNGFNGTLSGTLNCNPDSPRYLDSMYFDGSATISHSNGLIKDNNQEWTCMAWVKPLENIANTRLNNFNKGNKLYQDAGGNALLYLNSGADDSYIYSNRALSKNEWSHIAFVFKNSTSLKKIYINGEDCSGSGPTRQTPAGIPDTVIIGENFTGYISDYREYATALSANDIKQIYQTSAFIDNNQNVCAYEFREV